MKVETLAEVPALWDRLGELAVLKHKERSKYETLLIQLQALGYSRTGELDKEVSARLRAAKTKQKTAQTPGSNWPRALAYDPDDDALNAKLFLGSRPGQLIAVGKEFFSTFQTGEGATLWRSVADLSLGNEIAQTDKANRLRSKVLTATINRVRFSVQKEVRPFEWIAAPENAPEPRNTALFRNGLLNVETGELLPLDGSYFATAVPEFDYRPEAKCPHWLQWLDERLSREYHATLQEILGYLLTPDSQFHRFFSFVGPPRSGKGTLKGIAQALVGPGHYASLMLADFGQEFGLMGCVDKRLIVVPDSRDVSKLSRGLALERLLSITGGDEISIPRKYLGPLTLRLAGRLLVLGNKHAAWLDESGALTARQITIAFDRSFEGREDNAVLSRLHGELSGIANWALEGLRRLRENREFTMSQGSKEIAQTVRASQSPALRFAQECLIVTGKKEDFTPADSIFRVYQRWAKEEGLRGAEVRSRTKLLADLEAALRGVKSTQRRLPESTEGAYRPRGLRGISGVRNSFIHWVLPPDSADGEDR